MKGLTLIEVLITMGIGVVVGVLLLVVIVNSAGLFYSQSSKLSQGLNINDALSQVRQSIRQSSSIAATFTQGGQTYTSGMTQLVLKVPSLDASNNIIVDTFDYAIFFLDQKKLRLKTFPNALSSSRAQDQILATEVDSLIFKYLDAASPPNEVVPTSAQRVLINLTLKQKSGAGWESSTATSEANLRND